MIMPIITFRCGLCNHLIGQDQDGYLEHPENFSCDDSRKQYRLSVDPNGFIKITEVGRS